MPEWPEELLAGLERPRALPGSLRTRLEELLVTGAGASGTEPRPLGDDLSARLAGELADPLTAAFAGIDGPRPLPAATRATLRGALAPHRRRRAPLVGAAAAVVLLAGGAAVGLVATAGSGHQSQASRASSSTTLPVPSVPGTSSRAAGGPDATGSGGPTQQGAAAAAPSPDLMAPSAGGASGAPGAAPTVTGLLPSSGPIGGGTWVTISGSGFAGTTGVRFGTAQALAVVVVSGTELRAEAPPHAAGTVDVVVTVPDGTSATSPADGYTYTP